MRGRDSKEIQSMLEIGLSQSSLHESQQCLTKMCFMHKCSCWLVSMYTRSRIFSPFVQTNSIIV